MIRARFKCPKCLRDISLKAESKESLMTAVFQCPHCGQSTPFATIFGARAQAPSPARQDLHTHIAGYGAAAGMGQMPFQKTRVAQAGPLAIVVEDTGRRIPVGVGSHILGRESSDSSASVKLAPDPYMSRLHARLDIMREGNRVSCRIQPLRSSNAVIVNSSRLEEGETMMLKPNDKVVLGMTTFHLEVNR